jgi:hypothetical protein
MRASGKEPEGLEEEEKEQGRLELEEEREGQRWNRRARSLSEKTSERKRPCSAILAESG